MKERIRNTEVQINEEEIGKLPEKKFTIIIVSSLQFSRSVVSDSLRPHELQHARPPCSSPTPRVHSESCPSSQWCHPAISSSVVPFSFCLQSLPGSESFPTSQLFTWGGQSTGVSALASFIPKKSQGWSPSEWTRGRNTSKLNLWDHQQFSIVQSLSLVRLFVIRWTAQARHPYPSPTPGVYSN